MLVKAAFASDASWCQHSFLAIEDPVKAFSGEIYVCVEEVSSFFSGEGGCSVLSFFFFFPCILF